MPFRYQRRINFGAGWGFNLSLRGVSSSYRSKWGSIGPRGFSLRTGIPGLSFHQSWKGFGILEVLVLLGLLVINAIFSIIWTLIEIFLIYLLPIVIQIILWCIYFIIDRFKSKNNEEVLQRSLIANTPLVKPQSDFTSEDKKVDDLKTIFNDLDILRINESAEKIKVVIAELKSNLSFRKYLKKCNLTSYGHLLLEESIIEHIVYSDIYRIISLIDNPILVKQVFCHLEDAIRGPYKSKGESSFYINCELNNIILNEVAGLNAIIFKIYDEEKVLNIYSDVESALYSLQFCLVGIKYEKWRIQVRNLASDPYQELHAKVF